MMLFLMTTFFHSNHIQSASFRPCALVAEYYDALRRGVSSWSPLPQNRGPLSLEGGERSWSVPLKSWVTVLLFFSSHALMMPTPLGMRICEANTREIIDVPRHIQRGTPSMRLSRYRFKFINAAACGGVDVAGGCSRPRGARGTSNVSGKATAESLQSMVLREGDAGLWGCRLGSLGAVRPWKTANILPKR